MTDKTTHHPRSGWQKDEIDLLFEAVRAANQDGRSLREVFTDVGNQLQRKPNSIRNYYYSRVRETPELAPRQSPFRAYSPEEVHELLRQVLMGRGSGESVRACVTRLSGGDRSLMLRYQNKYRSILKNRPEMLLSVAEELRREGLPCPENVVDYRQYGAAPATADSLMTLSQHMDAPGLDQLLDGLSHLLRHAQRPALPSVQSGDLWYDRWMDARQEADRLRVEVDLLKIALEDAREGREDFLTANASSCMESE